MERGPLKGVHTAPDVAQWYQTVLGDIDSLKLTQEDKLMIVGVAPWIYVYVDAQCGSYSTWQVHENSTYLFPYYEVHPDKIPNVIYMEQWADRFLESDLAKPFERWEYVCIEKEAGMVMMSPERAAWQQEEAQ